MLEEIEILISNEEISTRVKEIARQISEDFYEEDVLLVGTLKGAIYYMIDLSREIQGCNVFLDFIKVRSYGKETISSGQINLDLDLSEDITNKNVIIVEDIIDTGNTLVYLKEELMKRNPKSLKICVLLDKKDRRLQGNDVFVDYTGFTIEDKFVVGYGLDYDQQYRTLPYVGVVKKLVKKD